MCCEKAIERIARPDELAGREKPAFGGRFVDEPPGIRRQRGHGIGHRPLQSTRFEQELDLENRYRRQIESRIALERRRPPMTTGDPNRGMRVEKNHRRFRGRAANVSPFGPAVQVQFPLMTAGST